MQKISNISFKGIEQKHPPKNNGNISNQMGKELGVQALPVGDRSLAINPSLPSDFLNDGDILRYKKVQNDWAVRLAKRLNIPVENVLARLPEIEPGDTKTMLKTGRLGYFNPNINMAEINPIREMANLFGGDDSKIVHESTHGFFHNLRRAWAKLFTDAQLYLEAANVVLNKMYQGENGLIIKELTLEIIDGKQVLVPDVMDAPILSKEERGALVNTINTLKLEHLDTSICKLNDAGRAFVRETLIPQLNVYSKQISNVTENKEDKICEKMTNYIDAFFERRNLLVDNLIAPSMHDLEKNLSTPLSETEKNMARNSLYGLLSTQEGNFMQQSDQSGVLDNSAKSYFMSFEELLARNEESIYRFANIKQKIIDIEAKGLKPSGAILQEQKIVESNLSLLKLVKELDKIDKQIIGAEKSPEKLAELEEIKHQAIELNSNANIEKFENYVDDSEILKGNVNSQEDYLRLIEEKIPPELKEEFEKYSSDSKKLDSLLQSFNKLSSPENLLTETPENMNLKTQFETIMQKIKKIAPECDLIGIPKQFYNSEEEFLRVNEKIFECTKKWARRLL